MSREQLRRRRRRSSREAAVAGALASPEVGADPLLEQTLERTEELLAVIDALLAEQASARSR